MRQARITHQKTVLSDRGFDLIENTIDFGNGLIREHLDLYRKPAVSIFPIDDEGNIYLIYQYRYLHKQELLEGIAGMIDGNESPIEAAKRELKEETGIVASQLKEFYQLEMAGSFMECTQHLILARGLSFESAEPEDTERIRLVKMSFEEAIQKIYSREMRTSSSIVGLLMLQDKMKIGEL